MYDTKRNHHEHKHFWTRSTMGRVLALSALILGVSAALLGLSANGVLAGAPTAATSGPNFASPMSAKPLETLLNDDGTLNQASGFSGSVDPKGWRMETGPNGQPRFVKSDQQHQQQQHPPAKPRSSTSSSLTLAPGDENWDDRFGTLGMNDRVYTIAISGSDVYVGGSFSMAGGVSANGIARWDGSNWSALGSGVDNYGTVRAITISGSDVYVGGGFGTAGGVSANNIAKWDGSTWSALGSGTSGSGGPYPWVYAIGISGSDVYAGGKFTIAGGVPANRIAKWDGLGGQWSALGSGMNERVAAIGISGSDVYVSGGFSTAGGVPASRIAKWDGSNWSALGSGVNNYVSAIAISGSDVYVGGGFTTAGGVPANRIARWDGLGGQWSALGSGVNGGSSSWVYAIGISGSDVYASGNFATAGGVPANSIAKWNGSSWSVLGSGINGPPSSQVNAIGISGSDVYVGGGFTTAGVNPSNNFGIWHMPSAVNLVGHVSWAGSTQPDTRQMQPLTLTLCSTSGGSTSTYIANTNASGYFTVDVASLITGTYNWREKGSRSLANGGTLTLTGGNQQAEMGVQRGGDADNDNVVGASDFNVLRATFNSVSDLRADFNNDGVTGIQDFTILKSNFGQAGAAVTCP